jgi:apolipoprotein D and lipocalin family protein
MHRTLLKIIVVLSLAALTGCRSLTPIPTVAALDLERFMGDWFVIASIPTMFEKDAYNAVETYRLDDDGTVQTTFRFNKGSSNGPEKVYRSRAYVVDKETNAHWGMQFVWPFKAEYRVIYLAEDYSLTMIGRSKRDYVWIMAREPSIPGADYENLLHLLENYGYDTRKVLRVPQQSSGG